MDQRPLSPHTCCAGPKARRAPCYRRRCLVLSLSTNYEQQPDGSYPQGRVYTRADNPTVEHAERPPAAPEGGGLPCVLFSSGMAAATAVFQALTRPGTTCWSPWSCMGRAEVAGRVRAHLGLDVEFTDTTDPDVVAAAICPGRTRLLVGRSDAGDLMWEITDLAADPRAARPQSRSGVRVAVDNMVATPVLTRPFEHGRTWAADRPASTSTGTATRWPAWCYPPAATRLERIRSWRRNAWAMPGPFEAWLLQRGMRTLFCACTAPRTPRWPSRPASPSIPR